VPHWHFQLSLPAGFFSFPVDIVYRSGGQTPFPRVSFGISNRSYFQTVQHLPLPGHVDRCSVRTPLRPSSRPSPPPLCRVDVSCFSAVQNSERVFHDFFASSCLNLFFFFFSARRPLLFLRHFFLFRWALPQDVLLSFCQR